MDDLKNDCHMRRENGSFTDGCAAIGMFCAQVNGAVCAALRNAYECGRKKAMEDIEERLQPEQGPVMMVMTRAKAEQYQVEQALQMKIYDWQVDYIWGSGKLVSAGRRTGKTTACIIKLCLSDGEPLHMYPGGKHFGMCDEDNGPQYIAWYIGELFHIYNLLKRQRLLKLRKIYFSREEAGWGRKTVTEDEKAL